MSGLQAIHAALIILLGIRNVATPAHPCLSPDQTDRVNRCLALYDNLTHFIPRFYISTY